MTRTYLLAGLAALGAVGCTAEYGSMVILQNQIPEEGCVISGSVDSEFRSSGLLHPDSQFGYVFTPVVRSIVDESARAGRLIFVQGADIRVENLADGSLAQEFGSRFSGYIPPGDTIGVAFEITQPGLAEGDYLARIQMYGTMDGGDVESQEFEYPVRVSADAFEVVVGSCSALPIGYVGEQVSNECNPLQDGFIECCDDGGAKVCPARGPSA